MDTLTRAKKIANLVEELEKAKKYKGLRDEKHPDTYFKLIEWPPERRNVAIEYDVSYRHLPLIIAAFEKVVKDIEAELELLVNGGD